MKIRVRFVHLHDNLFLNGINYGTKLDTKSRKELELIEDTDEDRLFIREKNKKDIARVPMTSVFYTIPLEEELEFVLPPPAPKPVAIGKVKAQVSSPTGHVFQGEGAGLTGRK